MRRVGPFRLAFARPAGPPIWSGDESTWQDEPFAHAPADLILELAVPATDRTVGGAGSLDFDRLDDHGYAFRTVRSEGTVDAYRRGHVRLAYAPRLGERDGALHEAFVATTYAEILRRGGLILHGATLVLDGRAHVVVGPSGAGKSTLAGRFPGRHLHDENAVVVPDGQGGWRAWRHGLGRTVCRDLPWDLPLASLHVLGPERDRTATWPMPWQQGVAWIAQQAMFAGGVALPLLLEHATTLATAVPPAWLSHHLASPTTEIETALQGGGHG